MAAEVSAHNSERDEAYIQILLNPIRECRRYRPAFGQDSGEGVTLAEFKSLYSSDPLYHWVGMDDDLMYAAHKAAGGMTSLYRQLGIGVERLYRRIIMDSLGLTLQQVEWSYFYDKGNGAMAVHTLDARLSLEDINDAAARTRIREWLNTAADDLGLPPDQKERLKGLILEIRQGYKSADSKRQNADLRFGLRAYTEVSHLPVILIASTQASDVVCRRYRSSNILVLKGVLAGPNSSFDLFKHVIGYDLKVFFERNSAILRTEFSVILRDLLSP